MARKKVTPEVEQVRNYVYGVAKNLVDRLYGPQGPAWGTKLSELEDVAVAIREVLSEEMIKQGLERQAKAVEERPPEYGRCPSCERPIDLTDEPEPRILLTRGGEAEWSEPKARCRKCRRSFFPSVEKFGD